MTKNEILAIVNDSHVWGILNRIQGVAATLRWGSGLTKSERNKYVEEMNDLIKLLKREVKEDLSDSSKFTF